MTPTPLQLDWLHPGRRQGSWRWLGIGVLCLGLAAAALEVSSLLEANADIAATQDKLRALRGRGALAKSPGQADAVVDGALQRMTLPWNRLLRELELAGGAEVALLTLETDAAKGQVRLMGEAKSLAEVLAYVERLGHATSLSRPQLLSQEYRQSDGERVLAFSIEARWNNKP